MREKEEKEKPQIPSRLRGRGVEVSKTLFYEKIKMAEKSVQKI